MRKQDVCRSVSIWLISGVKEENVGLWYEWSQRNNYDLNTNIDLQWKNAMGSRKEVELITTALSLNS